MTSTVTIHAACAADQEVRVVITDENPDGGERRTIEDFGLQNGETADRLIYDGRMLAVMAVPK